MEQSTERDVMVSINQAKCIGCGTCKNIEPSIFNFESASFCKASVYQDDEEVPEVLVTISDPRNEAVLFAEKQCPAGAIMVREVSPEVPEI
jgi:ferredoxin